MPIPGMGIAILNLIGINPEFVDEEYQGLNRIFLLNRSAHQYTDN